MIALSFAGLLLSPCIGSSSSSSTNKVFVQDSVGNGHDTTLLKEFLLAILGETVENRRALATEAIQASSAVLNNDERDLSAHLIMIAGLGIMARSMNPVESIRERYGWRSKEFLDKALQIDSNDAWVHALYGTWHLEVIRRSKIFGPLVLGADRSKGIEHFEKALQLDQQDPLLPFAFSVSLISLDDSQYAERALALLDHVISIETSRGTLGFNYSRMFQEARILYRMILEKDHSAAGERARSLL